MKIKYLAVCIRNRTNRKISAVEILVFYFWYTYYGWNSINENTNYIFTNQILKSENSFYFFGYGIWGINGYLFSKIFSLVFNLEKNMIIKIFMIIFLLTISVIFFSAFLGLFLGHENNIYFISFNNYLYDDIIFLIISILLHLFFHCYECLFINDQKIANHNKQ